MIRKLTMFAMMIFMLTGCAAFQVQTGGPDLERIGGLVGDYVKSHHPEAYEKSIPWVKGVVDFSDVELAEIDVLSVGFNFINQLYPDEDILLLIEAVTIASGIKLTINPAQFETESEYHEAVQKYAVVARKLFKGYLN
jgi:hypothetical protein